MKKLIEEEVASDKVSSTLEMDRDYSTRFIAESYVSDGYFMHFHRNMELYGVIDGMVNVVICGESKILTGGQMAIINGLESHSYEIAQPAEIFYFHIGTEYLRLLHTIFDGKKMKRWLEDSEYNKRIFEKIREVINCKEEISEIRRYGIVYNILADIVEHYGVEEEPAFKLDSDDKMVEVVQYIYDHYRENLNLESLSAHFGFNPVAFSTRFNKYVKTDLRVFINNVRVQMAVQLMEKKDNRSKTISEIAKECGFTTMMTFYRSYKRNFKFRKLKN